LARLEKDNKEDYIHRDTPNVDFAYLLYLSESNPESGTKIYDSCDADKNKEQQFVQFIQNRFVLFDANIRAFLLNLDLEVMLPRRKGFQFHLLRIIHNIGQILIHNVPLTQQ